MNLRMQYDCANMDWDCVAELLKAAGMSHFDRAVHQKAFENSHTVVFVFDENSLVGCGRAISDGIRQAAIYDIAVLPEYQGKKIGKQIVSYILSAIPQCNFILYASPGKESFYETLNFRKMKTGMALFHNAQHMQAKGFTE